MFSFLFLNILAICILGVLTSFTDLKKGIIQNKIVFPMIALSFLLNFLNGASFLSFMANGFLAFLLGFLLWLASLWSAGDSKLFLAFALLLPLNLLNPASLFPGFSIFVYSFVPAFAILLCLVLFKTTAKQKLNALKEAFKPGLVLSVAVFLFAFYWIVENTLLALRLELDFLSVSLILFVLVSLVEFFLPKKSIYFFSAVALAFLFLEFNKVLTTSFLSFFLVFLLIVMVVLFFVLRLGLACFGKEKKLSELRPGMVLLEPIVKRGNRIEKKEALLPSFINIFSEIKEKTVVETGPKGLSSKDINFLKQEQKKGRLSFEKVSIQETLPFAPIIFIGTILALLSPTLSLPLF
jgi:preflagellin peptidase FlaK